VVPARRDLPGPAAEIASLPRADFIDELAARKIDVIQVDLEDLKRRSGLAEAPVVDGSSLIDCLDPIRSIIKESSVALRLLPPFPASPKGAQECSLGSKRRRREDPGVAHTKDSQALKGRRQCRVHPSSTLRHHVPSCSRDKPLRSLVSMIFKRTLLRISGAVARTARRRTSSLPLMSSRVSP
jgi:hypothetical protein